MITDKNGKDKAVQQYRDVNAAEYFSKFRKTDRLSPVLTIVFYHGEDEWDGATELYQLLDMKNMAENKMLERYIPNYKINLLDVSNVEDIDRFHTDLHIIFDMIKYRKDKDKMRKIKDIHKG